MNQRRVEEGKEVDMWLGLRVIDAGVDKGGEKRSTRWGERGIDTHTDTEGENAEELGSGRAWALGGPWGGHSGGRIAARADSQASGGQDVRTFI